ncbi:MAG: amino acid ABC transporter permease [Coriobacteriia bacterium]|nr:amino acid ABC transporter permease [Coriobacteriia bacterium]
MSVEVMLSLLFQGFFVSLLIFFVTLLGSLPLGVLVALARMSSFKPLAVITRVYISVMRGTPLMLQILAIFFGPFFILGVSLSTEWKIIACLIAFVINYAAYFGEIYRSGIQSIPQGQWEAAEVLGYTKSQTFMRVILPQVIKRIVPSLANEVITLVKDTSLAFVIGIAELMSQAKALSASQASMIPFVMAGLMYWLFNMIVETLLNKLEIKLDYYHE